MKDAPTYQPPPPDPAFAQLQAQSQQQNIAAMQSAVSGDTARLMQQYGTRIALAAKGFGSPLLPIAPGEGGPSLGYSAMGGPG